jgi:hypothetical protein
MFTSDAVQPRLETLDRLSPNAVVNERFSVPVVDADNLAPFLKRSGSPNSKGIEEERWGKMRNGDELHHEV